MRFFRESVEVSRALGCQAVLLTTFREQVPSSLPPDIRHFGYAPFSQLLPRAAAFVHHGGIGTTAQALKAGVPQLIVPMAYDQPDHAARVVRLGAGLCLSTKRYRASRVVARLDRLLKDAQIKTRCAEIASRFSGTSPLERTCDLLEELGHRKERDGGLYCRREERAGRP
jgi:UDP:flavonoid glycosyltransferase YjiC (YdhE family)